MKPGLYMTADEIKRFYHNGATNLEEPDSGLKPILWNGEGLPPVGTVCESEWPDKEWHEVIILAHDFHDGEERAVYRRTIDGEDSYFGDMAHAFRPIRTSEQIAADERLHAIRNALTAISKTLEQYNLDIDCSVAMRATVEAMVDAGYHRCP